MKGAAERFKIPESEVAPGLISHHRAMSFVEAYGCNSKPYLTRVRGISRKRKIVTSIKVYNAKPK